MTVQLNTTIEHDPIIGKHWSQVDTDALLARHMFKLSCELREVGACIPVAKLFALEALGYWTSGRIGAETYDFE